MSLATMRRAIERGINWIDTAAIYGLGHSEKMVGLLLREMPAAERPLVFTKCGLIWDPRDRMAAPRRLLTPASIRKECRVVAPAARRRADRPLPVPLAGPERYAGRGLVGDDAGARRGRESPGRRRVELRRRRCSTGARPIGHVDSLQPPFSMINRTSAAEGDPVVRDPRRRRHLLQPDAVRSADRQFRRRSASLRWLSDDWRRRAPEFQPPNLARNLALRDALRPIARRHDTSVSAVAIAWALAWPGVTAAIVGARTPAQVDGWIGAAGLTLANEDLADIAVAIQRTGAGTGPVPAGSGENRSTVLA